MKKFLKYIGLTVATTFTTQAHAISVATDFQHNKQTDNIISSYNTLPPTPEKGTEFNQYNSLPPTPEMTPYNTLPPTPEMRPYNTLPPTPEMTPYNTLPPTPEMRPYNTLPPTPDYGIKTTFKLSQAMMSNLQHIRG